MSGDVCVFGDTDVMKSVSVTEGDSVTLNTDVTEVQRDDQILWMFGPKETRTVELYKHSIDMFSSNEIFGDRLQLDSFTGSLTIRNIRSTDSGLYKRMIRSNRGNSDKTFNVTKNNYSCVINNPIRNQTTHLNITQLCHRCPGMSVVMLVLFTDLKGLKCKLMSPCSFSFLRLCSVLWFY
uniref:Ig-like domain-containing protein n=1 Tax=Cyprinus carpio TaxID=7962 RepID=A0A8C2K7Y9_CYPCA